MLVEALDEGVERRDQAEVVEDARPKLPGELADLVERRPRVLLDLDEPWACIVRGGRDRRVQLEQDAGQPLPDLVVQFLADSTPLTLESGEYSAGGRATFLPKALEGGVDRACDRPSLGPANLREAPVLVE